MRDRRMGKVLNTLGDWFSDATMAATDQSNADLFGTTDVYAASTGQASGGSGFSFSDVGNILSAAGQVLAFGQKLDAAGNPIPASSATPIASTGMKISLPIIALLGVGAYLLIAK